MPYRKLLQSLVDSLPVDGWCSVEKAQTLAMVVAVCHPKIVVEIGVFAGRSLIPMALAMKYEKYDGKIIAIDSWNAGDSIEGQAPADAAWWNALDHQRIFDDFNAALLKLGIDSLVEIRRCRSDKTSVPYPIDLLHIDGNHGLTAVSDAQFYGVDGVRVGGLCCVDDIGWVNGGPGKAVELLKEHGFVELYPIGTGVMLQRVKRK